MNANYRRSVAVLAVLTLTACAGPDEGPAQEPPTSEQESALKANKAVVMRFVQELKNQGNLDSLEEITTPDFVQHFPDPNVPPGREGTRIVRTMLGHAFPDLHVTVLDLIAEGDRVVERSVGTATHLGDFQGTAATGRRITWTETHVYRIQDGRIAEHWPEINLLAVLTQIGAIPPPAK